MKKGFIKAVSGLCVLAVTLCGFTTSAYGEVSKDRVYGLNRIETSQKISQKGWAEGSETAVIAQGYVFADAICAAPLAKKYNAPILLSSKDKLSDDVIGELKRLKTKKVILVGGTGALSSNIESQLKELNINEVERISGANRYETSVKIAEKLGNTENAAVVSGIKYADGLSIASIAAQKGMPVLLTQKDSVPSNVKEYIDKSDINKYYVIGEQEVISDTVKNSLTGSERLGGADRYKTNLEVLKYFKNDLNFDNIYFAKGSDFADALSISALSSSKSAPVVLTYSDVYGETINFLKSNMKETSMLTAVGGTSGVLETVLDEVINIYNPKDYTDTITPVVESITQNITPDGDWSVLALNKAGKDVPADYLDKVKQYMDKNTDALKVTDYARLTLSILAAGGNPEDFNNVNLVEKIYTSKEINNASAEVFSLIALDAKKFEIPETAEWNRDKLVKAVLDSRTKDNGWTYWGENADPDMTGLALSALAPYYKTKDDVKSAVDTAVALLSSMQTKNGGFASWGAENSNSTAMVIAGLCDLGIDPAGDGRFVKNGKNPIDALLTYKMSDNKGFGYTDNKEYNALATEQGLRALVSYNLFKADKGSVYSFK